MNTPCNAETPAFLTTKEVSEMFRIDMRTVARWVDAGHLPRPRKIGRTVRFPAEKIRQIVDETARRTPD